MTDFGGRLIYDTDAQHMLVDLAVKRGSDLIPIDMITYILFNAVPTAEARHVIHAKWEKHKCTNCGKAEPGYYDYKEDCIIYEPSAYCPSCGAMMWR